MRTVLRVSIVLSVFAVCSGQQKSGDGSDRLTELRRQLSSRRLLFSPSRRFESRSGQHFSTPAAAKSSLPEYRNNAPTMQDLRITSQSSRDPHSGDFPPLSPGRRGRLVFHLSDEGAVLPPSSDGPVIRTDGTRSRVEAYLGALQQKFGVPQAKLGRRIPVAGYQRRSKKLDPTAGEDSEEEEEEDSNREDRGILFFPGNVRYSFGIPAPKGTSKLAS